MKDMAGVIASIAALSLAVAASAWGVEPPRVAERDGRHALLVEGAPFLVLGAQINNSSSWPAVLPEVWPALEAMHANAAEAPVYWEQMEPQKGTFDFSTVDVLVEGARQHKMHLVLLWFGTWKNGNMHYAPEWVKTDTRAYPRMINAAGEPIDVLSANSRANLEADKAAFTALMRHLKEVEGTEHTVLMMQVENEPDGIGAARDFSTEPNRVFAEAVPADLLKVMHKDGGTWREVFGGKADENGTWHMRRLWNGDQTDRGLNFRGTPAVVRVRVGTF